ncbi:MAG: C4-type zinc ribbon domain-containing protein [Verrucomicrobia subdivision 3 bacterium]|nr:C4-type zinc ribbon domain-containing protein [Limisphaerales bacterium]
MLEVIEKLLILQDRDRKIARLREELARIPTERRELQAKAAAAQAQLEAAKHKGRQIETERKKLELEVEAKKQLIERYSLQQFQTKKNEEYKALAHEIDMCRHAINKLDDQQLELMEQAEAAQREVAAATKLTADAQKNIDARLADLAGREANQKRELEQLESNRGELASAVDESTRIRYERLFKHKGQNVVVGIQHGVCGGCHMQLSRSTVVTCQAEQEIVTCTNCGRILYYTRDMDLAVAE